MSAGGGSAYTFVRFSSCTQLWWNLILECGLPMYAEKEVSHMIGLFADVGFGSLSDLFGGSGIGLSGPVGMGGSGGGDSVGLSGGVGLGYDSGGGFSVGLNDGVGLFA
jgi:hypothetical protein